MLAGVFWYYKHIKKAIKKRPEGLFVNVISELHEVCNLYSSVVLVGVGCKSTRTLSKSLSEWVRNHTVTSLETNFWLEGVRVDCSNLL